MKPTCPLVSLALLLWGTAVPCRADEPPAALAGKVRTVLELNCYRCHGQNGSNEGGFDYVLDFPKLIGKKVIPGNPGKSRLLRRMQADEMPPEDEKQRPSKADIALVKQWIEAGAPAPAKAVAKARAFKGVKEVLTAIRDHLRQAPPEDRPYLRYFTLAHLHNLPADKIQDGDLPIYRAALSKLINSLSWQHRIVVPEAVDPEQTVLVIDLRQLDWDKPRLWQEILKQYPYGLKHDRYPEDRAVNELAREVYELAGTDLPFVRADWFIAAASRPPLYHTMLQLPHTAAELEHRLKVDVIDNFQRGTLARSGFAKSGVSEHNRLVERHAGLHGAYWKSYDFKSSDGVGNLQRFPLGPRFTDHPLPRQAFEHDGGEIIFNLPNGLQGYMLVNGQDRRIDAGPVEVVNDSKKRSGTPVIVNGLSCMSCHARGMITDFQDDVREGTAVKGEALDKVRQLYPKHDAMTKLLKEDEERFLQALDKAIGPFLKTGASKDTPAGDFPEPITAISKWYLLQVLGPDEVACELGLTDGKELQGAVRANRRLRELGLGPLAQNGVIKREVWESLKGFVSPFQEAARELERGTPKRFQ
jgi:serine/threonine-protein kinase